MRKLFFAFVLVLFVGAGAAWAASDPTDFRIRNVYVGMPEKQFIDTAGELLHAPSNEFKDPAINQRLEMWQVRRKRDVLVGIDKTTRKVVFVAGDELTRQGASIAMEGDYAFRAALGLMPLKHDDDWIYHLDKFSIAVELELEAAKTGPIISRFVMADPSLPVHGGYPEGAIPRPGADDPGVR